MITMSSEYTETLKAIKQAEEASYIALAERKKALGEKLEKAESETSNEISEAKGDAESYVSKQMESARSEAEADSRTLVDSTKKDAEKIAHKKLGKSEFKKIIEETILSEFKGA